MDSYPGDFPFGIMDVVELLHLRIRRRQANSVYVDCPFCGDRRGKMNVNFVKNVWRCNYCDEHGGMLALYARLNNTTTSDAYWEIGEALCNDFHRERPNSGFFILRSDWHWMRVPHHSWKTRLGIFIFRLLIALVMLALINSAS